MPHKMPRETVNKLSARARVSLPKFTRNLTYDENVIWRLAVCVAHEVLARVRACWALRSLCEKHIVSASVEGQCPWRHALTLFHSSLSLNRTVFFINQNIKFTD